MSSIAKYVNKMGNGNMENGKLVFQCFNLSIFQYLFKVIHAFTIAFLKGFFHFLLIGIKDF